MARTARYWVLGDPGPATELWVALHGYGQLAERFLGRFQPLPGLGTRRAVVAPEALSRFYVDPGPGEHGPASRVGASWMTREAREDEIADYVAYLDTLVAGIEHSALVVLGFSQGSETASRWAVLGRHRARELVLWGGGLAADLDMDRAAVALTGTRVTVVAGHADGWARRRAADSLERLAAAGLDGERVDYEGGHRLDGDLLARRWP